MCAVCFDGFSYGTRARTTPPTAAVVFGSALDVSVALRIRLGCVTPLGSYAAVRPTVALVTAVVRALPLGSDGTVLRPPTDDQRTIVFSGAVSPKAFDDGVDGDGFAEEYRRTTWHVRNAVVDIIVDVVGRDSGGAAHGQRQTHKNNRHHLRGSSFVVSMYAIYTICTAC